MQANSTQPLSDNKCSIWLFGQRKKVVTIYKRKKDLQDATDMFYYIDPHTQSKQAAMSLNTQYDPAPNNLATVSNSSEKQECL